MERMLTSNGTGAIRGKSNGPWRVLGRTLAVIVVGTGLVRLFLGMAETVFPMQVVASPMTVADTATTTVSVTETPEQVAGMTTYQTGLLISVRRMLPHQQDSVTTFDAIDFEAATLVYGYSVKGRPRDDLDVEAFRAKRLGSYCETLNALYRPGEIEAIRHRYQFENGAVIEVDVSRTDCGYGGTASTSAPTGSGNFITDIEREIGIDISR
jgi:hypothetical protein